MAYLSFRGSNSGYKNMVIGIALVIMMISKSESQQPLTSTGYTTYDGMSNERGLSFYRFDGTNAISVPLDTSHISSSMVVNGTLSMEYFLRMWIRVTQNPSSTQAAVFLEIPGSLRCFQISSYITCQFLNGGSTLSLQLSNQDSYDTSDDFFPFDKWLHIALSGSPSLNQTYLRVDMEDQVVNVTSSSAQYLPLGWPSSSWNSTLGNSQNKSSNCTGLQGDLREFLFSQQFIYPQQVSNIRNQVIYWNMTQIANQRLARGELSDSNRPYQQTATLVNGSSATPTWSYEQAPIDMCQAPMNYTNLPLINSDIMNASSTQLDSRAIKMPINFGYTVSLWMKTAPGMQTTTNPQLASSSLYFFQLQGAFALWFNDTTSIRIFFYAAVGINQQPSQESVYFPQGRWANLQISISRNSGYDMRVYDLQRRLVSRATEQLNLFVQLPIGTFTLFKNFKGYMKQVMVFNTQLTLPVDLTNGQYEAINNSSLLIYYKFDQQYFNLSPYSNSTLSSLAYNGGTQPGPSVTIFGNLTFQNVDWDQSFTFSTPSQIGTLNQSISLYDGLGCQRNVSQLYKLQDKNQAISYQLPSLSADLSAATVEFWYKGYGSTNATTNTTSYLFSLYSQNSQTEYMAVFQSSGILQCRPFSGLAAAVVYADFNSSTNVWQHIFCKFQASYDISVANQVNGRYEPQVYSSDLSQVDPSLTVIPSDSYYLIIGNSYQMNQGPNNAAYFRELRFWQSSRSILEISQSRFTQIPAGSSGLLIAYFKLTNELADIVNYVSLYQTPVIPSKAVRTSGVISDVDDSQTDSVLICPQYSFRNQATQICFRNPFLSHGLVVIPTSSQTFNDGTSLINWVATSQFSNMTSSYARDSIFSPSSTSNWYTDIIDSSATLNVLSQTQASFISFNSSLRQNGGGGGQMTLRQSVKDTTYQSSTSLQVNLHPCQYFIPINASETGIQEVYITALPGVASITFQYQLINLCGNSVQPSFNSSMTQWNLSPQMTISSSLQQSSTNNLYSVTIQASDLQSIGINEAQYLIGSLYWQGSSLTPYQQQIVFKFKFVQTYSPNVKLTNASNSQTLMGEDLVLDGGSSTFITNSTSQQSSGLAYYWTCPKQFQILCLQLESWNKYLLITYAQFQFFTGSQFNTSFTFSLSVFNATDPDVNIQLLPSTQITVSWINVYRPLFTISSNSTQNLASTSNTFSVNYQSYSFNDPNLQVIWSIVPSITNSTLISRSQYGNQLTLQSGALYYNQSYSLSAAITNKLYAFAQYTQAYVFSTGLSPLVNGAVRVNQTNGTAMVTNFAFSIANWTCRGCHLWSVKYQIVGVLNSQTIVVLTSRPRRQNESVIMQVPQVQSVTFLIYSDFTNETISVSIPLNVSANPQGSNVQIPIYNSAKTQLSQLDYLQALLVTSTYLSIYNSSSSQQGLILQYLTNMTQNNVTSTILRRQLDVLQIVTDPNQATAMTNSIVQSSIQVLSSIVSSLSTLNGNDLTTAFQVVATSLSNIFLQSQQLASSTQGGTNLGSRLLQQQQNSTLLQLLAIKGQLETNMCSQTLNASSNIQQNVITQAFHLIVESFTNTTVVEKRAYISAYNQQDMVTLPIRSIASQSNLCNQVTFFNTTSLFQGFQFPNQSVSQIATMIQLQQSTSSLQVNHTFEYEAEFAYNFNSSIMEFRNNQTVIETLSYLSLLNLNQTIWNSTPCTNTQYSVQDELMISECANTPNQVTFIGVVTDLNRVLVVDQNMSLFQYLLSIAMNFDVSIIPVLVLIILFNILMPLIGTCLDKRMYRNITQEKVYSDISEVLLREIAYKKGEVYEQVIYSRELYSEYSHIDQVDFCNITNLFCRNIHPLISFFTRFDFEYKRLSRFMVLSIQVSIIAIACSIYFSINVYRRSEQGNPGRQQMLDMQDFITGIVAGVVLSILTLPPFQILVKCLKSKIRVHVKQDSDEKNDGNHQQYEGGEGSPRQSGMRNSSSSGMSKEGIKDQDRSLSSIIHHKTSQSSQFILDEKSADISQIIQVQNSDRKEQDRQVEYKVTQDNRVCLKLTLMLLVLLFAFASILIVAFVSAQASRANSQTLCLAFFIALINGHFILNSLRAFLNAILVPAAVQNFYSEGMKLTQILFISEEAIQMLEDLQMVYEIKVAIKQSVLIHVEDFQIGQVDKSAVDIPFQGRGNSKSQSQYSEVGRKSDISLSSPSGPALVGMGHQPKRHPMVPNLNLGFGQTFGQRQDKNERSNLYLQDEENPIQTVSFTQFDDHKSSRPINTTARGIGGQSYYDSNNAINQSVKKQQEDDEFTKTDTINLEGREQTTARRIGRGAARRQRFKDDSNQLDQASMNSYENIARYPAAKQTLTENQDEILRQPDLTPGDAETEQDYHDFM